ncbi:MAG: ABC transporter permease [Nitrososphaerales archaeon]
MEDYQSFNLYKFFIEFKASFLKDFKIYIRYPSWFVSDLISTPLWFLFFLLALILFIPEPSSPTIYSIDYFFWGYVFVIFLATSLWGIGHEIRTEQLEGTIEQLFLAPVSRLTLIIGRWARTLIVDLMIIFYTLLLVKFFSNAKFNVFHPSLLLFAFVLIEVTILGLGLLFSALALKMKSYNSLTTLLFITLTIVSGVYFPPSALPYPINMVSYSLPFTYLVDLLKYSALEIKTIIEISVEIPLSFLLASLTFLLGLFSFRWTERDLRKKGQIGFH